MDALEEFLERFASESVTDGTDLKAKKNSLTVPNMGLSIPSTEDMLAKTNADIAELNPEKVPFAESGLAKGLTVGIDALPHAMQLVSNIGGGQFQTGVESGGPGKATGAIISGASTGAQLGSALGPIGQAGGAVVGGLISAFSHKKAMKEYQKNMIEENLKKNELISKGLEQEWNMSQGLESFENLKNLRQKQI